MNKKDEERFKKISVAMRELVKFFEERGEVFVYTCAFKSTHDYKIRSSIITLGDWTSSTDLNIFELMAYMHRDILQKIIKN